MNATTPVTTGPVTTGLTVTYGNSSILTGITGVSGIYAGGGGAHASGITTVATGGTGGGSPWNYYFDGAGRAITVEGNARFEKDIIIKGVSLTDRLDAIETRLGILRPNIALEDKWEKLKALGEEYRKTEKEIIEGEQIWDTLSS